MARSPKPWYREDRQAWFVTIDGRRHNLGGRRKRSQAKISTNSWLAPAPEVPLTVRTATLPLPTSLRSFSNGAASIGPPRPTNGLNTAFKCSSAPDRIWRPCRSPLSSRFHIIEWIDKRSDWSSTYRRGIIAAHSTAIQLGREGRLHFGEPHPRHRKASRRSPRASHHSGRMAYHPRQLQGRRPFSGSS